MLAPTLALSIPRPWVWLVAHSYRRDWLVSTDPALLVGQMVALHSTGRGDHEGYRQFDKWTDATVDRKAVRAEVPYHSIVGVARIVGITAWGNGTWRLQLADARPVEALGPLSAGDLELWPLPAKLRQQLGARLSARTGRAA